MKRYFHAALFVFVLFYSCQKDHPTEETPPCPELPVPLTKKEILVKNKWQVDEVARSIFGQNQKFIKGGVNNTGVDYNLIRLTFKADGTGTYTDEVGIVHTTEWKFTSTNERNVELKIGPPSAQTFNWNLVEITEQALHNTTAVGSDVLVSARYIPVL